MANLKIKDSEIIKTSEDETQVTYTYKKPSTKRIFSNKTTAKKVESNVENKVTLVLFNESIIDKIQAALERILEERKDDDGKKKKSAIKRISEFLLQ